MTVIKGKIMGYSVLKKLKKEEITNFEKSYIKIVVYVQDIFDLIAYKRLKDEHGEHVKFVSDAPISRDSFLTRGPQAIRGEGALEFLKSRFPSFEFTLRDFPSLFYKEGDWKDFNGRAKSEKLLAGEEFFTWKAIDFDLLSHFSFLADESFWSEVESERLPERIVNIHREENTEDMISPVHWALECGSGKVLECSELIFGGSPQALLNLIRDKNPLSDSFMEFCESTRSSAELAIRFNFKSPLHSGGETFFIPLSYTHDWGHFVGEFKGDEAHFVHFFESNETSEEEVSRKLKLLKKSLEKIFPDFNQKYMAEYLVLRPESGCLKIDDKAYFEIKDCPKYLHFIHRNAPLVYSRQELGSCEDSGGAVLFDARAIFTALNIF